MTSVLFNPLDGNVSFMIGLSHDQMFGSNNASEYHRDEIEDEQYLFDGVKLTEAEYREQRYLKQSSCCVSFVV